MPKPLAIESNPKDNLPKIHFENGKFEKTFEHLQKVGSGGFGVVFKGSNIMEKKIYALKVIKIQQLENIERMNNEILKEIRLLSLFDHKNIIKYSTCWFENEENVLIDNFLKESQEEEDYFFDTASQSNTLSVSNVSIFDKLPSDQPFCYFFI